MRPDPRHAPAKPPTGIDDAAAYWSARRRLGLNDARDEALFARWRADPACAAAFDATERAVEAAGTLTDHPEVVRLRRRGSTLGARRRLLLIMLFGAIALVAAIVWSRLG